MTSRDVFGGATETVHVGCRVIVVVYAALAVVQVALVAGPEKWVLASVSAASAIAGLVCARRLPSAGPAVLHRMVWIVCAVPFVNSVLYNVATGVIAPITVMLSIVAIGAVATEMRPALLLVVSGVAAWGVAVAAWGPHPDGEVLGHSINLALACALSYAVFRIRALTGERLRLAEERLTERVRELDEARRQLELASTTDQLTGCFNRRGWDERVVALHRLAGREGATLTLGIIDLDRFKQFNDSYGHPTGDRLLKEASAAWHSALRQVDTLARYGGEEFTVLLPGADATAAWAVLERARAVTPLGQTFSAGVAQWDGSETSEHLIERADAALYAAKADGRNRVVVAEPRPYAYMRSSA